MMNSIMVETSVFHEAMNWRSKQVYLERDAKVIIDNFLLVDNALQLQSTFADLIRVFSIIIFSFFDAFCKLDS